MDLGSRPRQRPRSLADQVRAVLQETLASGGLKAGQVYPIQTLADQMGVSRTPVREALLQMQQAGLVRILPNQGVLVVGWTVEDVRQIFQIRIRLEVPAVRDAAARADADAVARLRESYARLEALADAGDRAGVETEDRALHAVLLEAAGNQRLADVVRSLRDVLVYGGYASTGHQRSLRDLVLEHRPIVEAVAEADADAAAAAMTAHLERTAAVTIELAAARAAGSD